MAWIGTLVGGLASAYAASKSGSSSSSSKSGYTYAQNLVLGKLANQISRGLTTGAGASPSTYVPTTNTEQSYLNMVSNVSNQALTSYKSAYLSNLANGVVPYDISNESANAYYANVLTPNINQVYNENANTLQRIYSGPTYWGTDRMKALERAEANKSNELTESYANLMWSEELARRTAIENAANRSIDAYSTLQGAQQSWTALDANLMSSAANLERSVQESNAADILSRYLMGEAVTKDGVTYKSNAYSPYVSLAMSLLGLGGTSVSSSTTGANALTGLMGGFGNWASSANWSDIANSFKSNTATTSSSVQV